MYTYLEKEILQELDFFYYYPNKGNLGDLLIAEATRQFFRRNGKLFKEYDPDVPPVSDTEYTLILGGGGLSSLWGGGDTFAKHLTAPQVKQGIVLAHSFHNVDSFIQSMDERHTLICREKTSYAHCLSLHPKARILMGHDMALLWKPGETYPVTNTDEKTPNTIREEQEQYNMLQKGWEHRVIKGVKNSVVTSNGEKIAFLLRTDKEKATSLSSPYSYDISVSYSSSCRETKYTARFIDTFAKALSYPDTIVTDRLHVAIMAHILGKKVYLIDNDYGKLSGVYEYSLLEAENVHVLTGNQLTPDLQKAWNKLHNRFFSLFRKKALTEREYHDQVHQNRIKKTKRMVRFSFGKRKVYYINKLNKLLNQE